jgi:hypothetical protein
VLALDALRRVFSRRMGDLVAQHRRKRGVIPGHREDAGVHHDLAARETVGVRLVLAEQRHFPIERGLSRAATASMRLATRCTCA